MQHFLPFSKHGIFEGFHYSKKDLKIGDTITSDLGNKNVEHYDYLWQAYSDVANGLGLYFPKRYGYAYDVQKSSQFPATVKSYDGSLKERYHEYVVTVDSKYVTRCDYRFSILLILDNGMLTPISLNYAMKHRNALLKHAFEYFSPTREEYVELISDKFVISQKNY